MLIREDTPLEMHVCGENAVYVKREDLQGDSITLPPWGKLLGIRSVMLASVESAKPVAHFSADGSWSGWALAALCNELGLPFVYAYPDSKKISRKLLETVAALYPATRFHPMRPGMAAVSQHVLRKEAADNGWQLLPAYFDHPAYFEVFRQRVRAAVAAVNPGCVVVSSGSGVTVSAITSALCQNPELFAQNLIPVYTTCTSATATIQSKMSAHGLGGCLVGIRKSPHAFADRLEGREAPFPCNQFWDMKQWLWLTHNAHKLPQPVLFWNLGGRYVF